MSDFDQQIREALHGAAEEPDGTAKLCDVARRRRRRGFIVGLQKVSLVVVVIGGTAAGIWGLNSVFNSGSAVDPAASVEPMIGTSTNGRIAFVAPVNDWHSMEIATVNPDGSDVQTLVGAEKLGKGNSIWGLDWSPDGHWLAFANRDWPGSGIWLVRADGSDLHSIVEPGTVEDPAPYASSPTWSPDGTHIAYLASDGITIIERDGSNPQRIEPHLKNIGGIDWSPDGSRFTFVGDGANLTQRWDIYTMNVDGSELTNLTHDDHINLDPSWSPDGSQILFRSRRSGDEEGIHHEGEPAPDEIYAMNPDGTEITRLTNNDGIDQSPRWSPDGSQITYDCQDMGIDVPSTICIVNADGTGFTKLNAEGAWPAWQPLPVGEPEDTLPDIASPEEGPEPTPVEKSQVSSAIRVIEADIASLRKQARDLNDAAEAAPQGSPEQRQLIEEAVQYLTAADYLEQRLLPLKTADPIPSMPDVASLSCEGDRPVFEGAGIYRLQDDGLHIEFTPNGSDLLVLFRGPPGLPETGIAGGIKAEIADMVFRKVSPYVSPGDLWIDCHLGTPYSGKEVKLSETTPIIVLAAGEAPGEVTAPIGVPAAPSCSPSPDLEPLRMELQELRRQLVELDQRIGDIPSDPDGWRALVAHREALIARLNYLTDQVNAYVSAAQGC